MKTIKSQVQQGFGALGLLIVLVVVGGVGFVAYRVANQSNANTNTSSGSQNSSSPIGDQYKLYEDEQFTLQYPKDWSVAEETSEKNGTKTTTGALLFTSPDFQQSEPQDDSLPTIQAGYLLEVRINNTAQTGGSYEEELSTIKAAQEAHGGNYEIIQIDGRDAILSDIKTHGIYWHATVYKDGKSILFRLNAVDEDKPEVKQLLKSILETVKLK